MALETEEFVKLLTSAQPALYARILALLPCRASASDALQEANLILWRKAAEFAPGTNFLAWASAVARYVVLNHRRSARRSRVLFDEDLVSQLAERQSDVLDSTGSLEALRKCLDLLPGADRELLLQRYGFDGSVRQLAEHRGLSPGALSQALFRLRERLLACVRRRLTGEFAS